MGSECPMTYVMQEKIEKLSTILVHEICDEISILPMLLK